MPFYLSRRSQSVIEVDDNLRADNLEPIQTTPGPIPHYPGLEPLKQGEVAFRRKDDGGIIVGVPVSDDDPRIISYKAALGLEKRVL